MKSLKEQNKKLRWEKLKLRLEIEQLIFWPESKATRRIINKYRLEKKIRDEVSLATLN